MTLEIRPIGEADVAGCVVLLAERHARHRAAVPLLSDAGVEPPADGLIALRDGVPVAYLAGEVRTNDFWGAHAWVELTGHAASQPEAIRDLYAAAAAAWVDAGARLHLALVPAVPELMDPWLQLGFGLMQAHGIRESGGPVSAPPPGVAIRPGIRDDLPRLAAEHGAMLLRHQAGPPTFTGLTPLPSQQVLAEWMETFEDSSDTLFLAERGDELVGHVLFYQPEPELGLPLDAVKLSTAVVLPGGRGQGIGRALADHGFAWAREAGYGSIIVDWRVANLEASRFWPARGFQVSHHRMYRMIGIG